MLFSLSPIHFYKSFQMFHYTVPLPILKAHCSTAHSYCI